ncbi:Thaumatin [Thalictrum thalictroides]|uniref:Thaumatin n=1 Tax=Thalictrum thalictroides TaxID=46969 RepID=A0A7J6UVL6_THATH|nr:Thaumatin [Thalictrum thalictroides]
MEHQVFSIFLLALMVQGTFCATFTFKNNCQYTVWPATLTGGGQPQLSSTGFQLITGANQSINTPAGWSGRFWARTGCTDKGRFTCTTADCGSGQLGCNGAAGAPPASLAEFTLNGGGSHNQDFYDISLVDGFNLPMSVTPLGRSSCKSTACGANINSVCPPVLSLKSDGRTISCKSACVAFNQPQYCCSGEFATPDKCHPTNYSRIFKNACPQAYSYAYDDRSSTFTCSSGANYIITFCP